MCFKCDSSPCANKNFTLQVIHQNVTSSSRIFLKLADFGLAVEVKNKLYVACGTPTYVAPEILNETGMLSLNIFDTFGKIAPFMINS